MEIDKFIKIYDEGFKIEREATLVKYASNKLKFKDSAIIGNGKKSFTVYTMDLTNEYIKINSDYRS